MKSAIYAGSFDPWSFGHQYVLESALTVFDKLHIVVALNPSKKGTLSSQTRARVIAHAINPFQNWWDIAPPFHIGTHIIVTTTEGLIADYARENEITTLVRGLRSTSDFEAEFNLYFSNRAIDSRLQTWAIMCPPELLYCSSTYVRAVVGKPNVSVIGTTFLAQSLMLGKSRCVGEILDLIQACSQFRFEREPADLAPKDLNASLQKFYSVIVSMPSLKLPSFEPSLENKLNAYLLKKGDHLKQQLCTLLYPASEVAVLWAILVNALTADEISFDKKMRSLLALNTSIKTIGKTEIPLFDFSLVEEILKSSAFKN